jgi:hypothetical protein
MLTASGQGRPQWTARLSHARLCWPGVAANLVAGRQLRCGVSDNQRQRNARHAQAAGWSRCLSQSSVEVDGGRDMHSRETTIRYPYNAFTSWCRCFAWWWRWLGSGTLSQSSPLFQHRQRTERGCHQSCERPHSCRSCRRSVVGARRTRKQACCIHPSSEQSSMADGRNTTTNMPG